MRILFLLLVFTSTCFAETGKFKIGLSLPLSGPLAQYGQSVQNGINLALQENPDLAKKFTLIFEDNKYHPKEAVGNINQFKTVNKVDLVYVWGVEPSIAAAGVVKRLEIPTILVSQYVTNTTKDKNIIRFINTGEEYSIETLKHLRKLKKKRIAIFLTESSFSRMMIKGLEDNLKNDEDLNIVESYLPDEFDFKPGLLKLSKNNYDILGNYLFPAQVKKFYEQADNLKIKLETFGSTPFESKTVIGDSFKLMQDAFYVHLNFQETFRKKYIKHFDDDMHLPYAANSYEFMKLTLGLFKNDNSKLSASEIITRYKEVKNRDSVMGKYSFTETDEDGAYFKFPLAVYQLIDQQGNTKKVS